MRLAPPDTGKNNFGSRSVVGGSNAFVVREWISAGNRPCDHHPSPRRATAGVSHQSSLPHSSPNVPKVPPALTRLGHHCRISNAVCSTSSDSNGGHCMTLGPKSTAAQVSTNGSPCCLSRRLTPLETPDGSTKTSRQPRFSLHNCLRSRSFVASMACIRANGRAAQTKRSIETSLLWLLEDTIATGYDALEPA